MFADEVDIFDGVVLGCRSPCRNDHGHGGSVVVVDVSPEQDESRAKSVLHVDELFEFGVGWVGHFAQPNIANADVQWVVVADASRYD